MKKVQISTITLSSTSMRDLKDQVNELKAKTEGDGRTYEFGPIYEPVRGYVGIDVFVFINDDTILDTDEVVDEEEKEVTYH